jgi:AcrR family transcriptional regulator
LADPRAVKSRQALGAALLNLLERKPFDQVTIREIAANAGVHYATFFRHHPTKESLLDEVAAEQIDRLGALTMPLLGASDDLAAFLALANYVNDHRALWTTLLAGGAAEAMRAQWLRVSTEVAMERAPKDGWLPIDLAVSCTVSLIVETILWWLAQAEGACSTRDLARYMESLVRAASTASARGAHPPGSPSSPN